MSRRRLPLALLAALALAAPAPALAFTVNPVQVGGELVGIRWPPTAFPLRFSLNNQPLSLLTNFPSNSTPQAAVEAAMRSWNLAPVQLRLDGTTPMTEPTLDGANLITFANTPLNRDISRNAIALTRWVARREGERFEIGDADIIFNPAMRFATDGSANRFDTEEVLAHEMGHALGLEHSFLVAATMNPNGDPGQTSGRSLSDDDIAGVQSLYGANTFTKGTISGRVQTTTGRPVFGAHVVATDAAGVARVSAMSDLNGNFRIPGLATGDYQVYAEPLRGRFGPDDLRSPYYADNRRSFITNFRPAFLGGNPSATPASVTTGRVTTAEAIRVETETPKLYPEAFTWSPDGLGWTSIYYIQPLSIAPGERKILALVGDGLNSVPRAGIRLSGAALPVEVDRVRRSFDGRRTILTFPITVAADAAPGPRNLYLEGLTERAVLSAFVEVVKP